jgi:predicted HTH transcriptional regulator
MLDETKRLGLPRPQFREMNEFVVSFRKVPALMPPQRQPQYTGTLWEEQEVVQHEILSQNQSDQKKRRLTQAVEYVQKYDFITNSIYRQLTGVSDRTAHRDLETLLERGKLKAQARKQHDVIC